MSAIEADYRTTKHVPSRKCYQLILEVPEEAFPNVCQVLGYPKTGENTYVGIALLNTPKSEVNQKQIGSKTEVSEGEKLRTRAVMLCNDLSFQKWSAQNNLTINICNPNGIHATQLIYKYCLITSRSELANNIVAQAKFRELLELYKTWQLENQYSDNLERV